MHRIFKRLNPAIAAVVFASILAPTVTAAQEPGWVRGYFDFFDQLCYPCTGPMETNEFCTCMVRQT